MGNWKPNKHSLGAKNIQGQKRRHFCVIEATSDRLLLIFAPMSVNIITQREIMCGLADIKNQA